MSGDVTTAPLLEITGLSARLRGEETRLLRSVSLAVESGQVRGLVGESGAGKSMIGRALLGILPRVVEIVEGAIRLDGQDLLRLSARERRRFVGRTCALIPQDPSTAFNPSRRIEGQIIDRLVDILGHDRRAARARALALLAEIGLPDPERVLRAYPHELSGGQRQRVLIASAFAAEPKLIVADEPTTALDVTVQKGILQLIKGIRERHGTAILFVTHDLGVVSKICDRVTVLYAGRVVEDTDLNGFFAAPAHPYSRALLAATPRYTEPAASLLPVPEAVVAAADADVTAADAEWRTARG